MMEMFAIKFTDQAIADLKLLKKMERRSIVSELETKLVKEPTVETRNRKKLRPKPTGRMGIAFRQVQDLL